MDNREKRIREKFGLDYLVETDSYQLPGELNDFFEQQRTQAVKSLAEQVLQSLLRSPTKSLNFNELTRQTKQDVGVLNEVIGILIVDGLVEHLRGRNAEDETLTLTTKGEGIANE